MSNAELEELFTASITRCRELESKHDGGGRLTRRECDELRHATQRLAIIGRELWFAAGRPDDPGFEILQKPIKLSPMPAVVRRPIDLTDINSTEVH